MSIGINEKEICFIICSNDQLYTEECIYYIMHLYVPAGYRIDVLTIEEAVSMTAGYNEGMHASCAKYKVYLHQDVFIVNKNFIQDFLDIFKQDETIGMIGMVGAPKLPANCIMWEASRCGALYAWNIWETKESWMAEDAFSEVEVIDGFLMITQYDIPWREDLFDKWDFYDCSQSKEFARRGYKIVVPELGQPWCIHDSGCVNLSDYEGERLKFVKEYGAEVPAIQEMERYRFTVILTSFNRKKQLQETLEWLMDVDGISNIVVVDNGSTDGTADWLSSQPYEYIWFDEGVQGYGKLWNTVLQNFETANYIVFMEAGVFPDKRSLYELAVSLHREEADIVNPVTNYYYDDEDIINSKEALTSFTRNRPKNLKQKNLRRTMSPNWKIWAAKRHIFDKIGLFREELKSPENVLTDYSLRMIKKDYMQGVCFNTCAYEDLCYDDEIYTEAGKWKLDDRVIMKEIWGMNYFNLKSNQLLVKYIQESAEKKFKVLEVGCDLGATLLDIQAHYPYCQTYGIDINETAVNIAKHVAEVKYGNIDELIVPFQEKFDYIIFGDVLEHLRHPEEVIRMCRNLLNDRGHIIASIPNVMHISVMKELIEGRFRYSDVGLLDRTHIHFFTFYEIMNLFQEAGYEVKDVNETIFNISERDKEIMEILLRLSENTEAWMYETFQYTVKAQKQ